MLITLYLADIFIFFMNLALIPLDEFRFYWLNIVALGIILASFVLKIFYFKKG